MNYLIVGRKQTFEVCIEIIKYIFYVSSNPRTLSSMIKARINKEDPGISKFYLGRIHIKSKSHLDPQILEFGSLIVYSFACQH